MCFLLGMLHLLIHTLRFGRDAGDISGYACDAAENTTTHPRLLSCFGSFHSAGHVLLQLYLMEAVLTHISTWLTLARQKMITTLFQSTNKPTVTADILLAVMYKVAITHISKWIFCITADIFTVKEQKVQDTPTVCLSRKSTQMTTTVMIIEALKQSASRKSKCLTIKTQNHSR